MIAAIYKRPSATHPKPSDAATRGRPDQVADVATSRLCQRAIIVLR